MSTIFTNYEDQSGSKYNGTDLQQLNYETSVIETKRDPISGLDLVVLADGPFAYSTKTYLNDSIKDYRKIPSTSVTNTPFPVKVESGGYFDLRLPIKGDYFLVPNTLDLLIEIELKVRKQDGSLRAIEAKDCLVPNDGLNPLKNVRAYFDAKPTIASGKSINQRQYGRILSLITESIDRESKNRRIKRSRTFFEGQKTADNRGGLTHSHIWSDKANVKTIKFKSKADGTFSVQNSTLAKAITNKFIFHVDLSNIPPFNQGAVYSRPCSELYLNLEFCNFSDWLRVSLFFE